DHSDTDTVLDHPADCIKAVELHAQFERPPGPRGLLAEIVLQSIGGAQADELLVERLVKSDLPTPAKRVTARRDQNQTVAGEWKNLQIAKVNQIDHNARIGKAGRDSLHDLMAWPFIEIDIDVRMGRQEVRKCHGEEFRRGDRVGQ